LKGKINIRDYYGTSGGQTVLRHPYSKILEILSGTIALREKTLSFNLLRTWFEFLFQERFTLKPAFSI